VEGRDAAAFFVDTEQRPRTRTVLQMGNSFVLLASEMVSHFGEWLPQYPGKLPSRFAETYRRLRAEGAAFGTEEYFKEGDKKLFMANFEKWNALENGGNPTAEEGESPKEDASRINEPFTVK
jgi:hypothetical protein